MAVGNSKFLGSSVQERCQSPPSSVRDNAYTSSGETKFRIGKRGLLEKGSFENVHSLERLENLENIQILEILQSVEDEEESDHLLGILENLI